MKMQYACILEAYTNNLLVDCDYEIATEAEENAATSNTTTPDKTISSGNSSKDEMNDSSTIASTIKGAVKRAGDMIDTLIQKILEIVKKAAITIKNRARNMILTDKGFTDQLRKRETSVKPLEAIKVVTYKYTPAAMDRVVMKADSLITDAIYTLKTPMGKATHIKPETQELLNQSNKDLIPYLISVLCPEKGIDTIPAFFDWLRDTFRGKKAEVTFRASQLPILIKGAENFENASVISNKKINNLQTSVNQMKTSSMAMKNAKIPDEEKAKYNKSLKIAMQLYNFYTTFIQYVYELYIEQCLNYRIIIKRFYQM